MPTLIQDRTYEKIMNDTYFDLPYGIIQVDKFLEKKFARLKNRKRIKSPYIARIIVESVPPEKVKYLPDSTCSFEGVGWEILVHPNQDLDIADIANKLDAIWFMTLDT